MYINDLLSLIENSTSLFADNTKKIGGQLICFCYKIMQTKLSNSKKNRLEFDMAKFEAILFDMEKLDQCNIHLYADNTDITCKSFVNDLGIIINNKLKWDSHINQRLSKTQLNVFSWKEKFLFL